VRVVEDQTRFQRASRYSSRQGRRVPLEGVVGRIVYQGDALDELVPLLALGEALHVGKGTALGMGRYRTGLFGPLDVRNHASGSSRKRSRPKNLEV
jgi:CRISPR/Cas system endoribonuclease Cas6 (RAMP superfamily)